MPAPESEKRSPAFDPLYLHARREALLILIAWAVCLAWTVGYSAWAGYGTSPAEVRLVLGIPGWVFWGVLVPWVTATLFSVWFGLRYIADDDLEATDPSAREEG